MSSATGDKPRSDQAIAFEELSAGGKAFPFRSAPHKVRGVKGNRSGQRMASDLDRKFDETLAAVTGPGGRLIIDRDAQGRAIVANFPATLPSLLRTFCALYA